MLFVSENRNDPPDKPGVFKEVSRCDPYGFGGMITDEKMLLVEGCGLAVCMVPSDFVSPGNTVGQVVIRSLWPRYWISLRSQITSSSGEPKRFYSAAYVR